MTLSQISVGNSPATVDPFSNPVCGATPSLSLPYNESLEQYINCTGNSPLIGQYLILQRFDPQKARPDQHFEIAEVYLGELKHDDT